MAIRIAQKRCSDCGLIHSFRKPRSDAQLVKALRMIECPQCHPESLKKVCFACRLPYELVGHHADGMCNSCFVSYWRFLIKQRKFCEANPHMCPPLQSPETC